MKTIILCFLLLAAFGSAWAQQTGEWKTRECKAFTISPAGFNGWYVMRGDIDRFNGAYISIRNSQWSITGADNGQGRRGGYETATSRGISGGGFFQRNAPDRGQPETMTGELRYSTLNLLTVKTVTIDWYAAKVMPGDANSCEKAQTAEAASRREKQYARDRAEKRAKAEQADALQRNQICAPFKSTLQLAEQGNADAQYKVANLYFEGCGEGFMRPPDYYGRVAKKDEWMSKAAANGHSEAKKIVADREADIAAAKAASKITIAGNSSSPSFETAEAKFRAAFNAAADSKSRGKALGVLFGDVYKNTSLTNEQKKNYLKDKAVEVYALDKEAMFQGFMKAECSSKEMVEIRAALPAEHKAFILKRANEIVDGFKVVKQ